MADNTLFLLLGGNQGDRAALLQQATDLIRQRIGPVALVSPIFETAPWGTFAPGEQPLNFYNMALQVVTRLDPYQALREALEIERLLGRSRQDMPTNDAVRHYASRPIDIDLIFFNGQVIHDPPTLILPHPRMHLRRFVLEPLCTIAPQFIHPIFNKTLSQLLAECIDKSSCSCHSSC